MGADNLPTDHHGEPAAASPALGVSSIRRNNPQTSLNFSSQLSMNSALSSSTSSLSLAPTLNATGVPYSYQIALQNSYQQSSEPFYHLNNHYDNKNRSKSLTMFCIY